MTEEETGVLLWGSHFFGLGQWYVLYAVLKKINEEGLR